MNKEEALKIIKTHCDSSDSKFREACAAFIPEIQKSENEKIRKALISILKSDFEKDTTIYDISVGDIIAWLEKQGDKVSAIEGFETEFERQVSHLIASAINREHEYNEGYVKWTANALLNFAKHELEKTMK